MYHDAKGNIESRWVDEEAFKAAKSFVVVENDKDKIKSSQLRKFYSDVKTQERIWINQDRSEEAFLTLLPQIKMLKAKVMYAHARKVVPLAFKDWMQKHVNAIATPKDFEAFLLHFEAVVGFSYGAGLKD